MINQAKDRMHKLFRGDNYRPQIYDDCSEVLNGYENK